MLQSNTTKLLQIITILPKILIFPQINPQNIFSLLLFISVYFLIRVSFSFLFIYLFVFSLFLFICFFKLLFSLSYFSFLILFFFCVTFLLFFFISYLCLDGPDRLGFPKRVLGRPIPRFTRCSHLWAWGRIVTSGGPTSQTGWDVGSGGSHFLNQGDVGCGGSHFSNWGRGASVSHFSNWARWKP